MLETPADIRPPSPLRVPVTVVLALVAPPLAMAGWILLSGRRRQDYLRSYWVRAGIALIVLGSLPLLGYILLAEWLWRDPNPNPVGLGLLFFFTAVVACVFVLVGILRVAWSGSRISP